MKLISIQRIIQKDVLNKIRIHLNPNQRNFFKQTKFSQSMLNMSKSTNNML